MMRIKLLLASLGVIGLIAFAGCGKDDPKSMSKEQVVEKAKKGMKAMAEAVKKNKDDCPAMGKALQKIADDMKGIKARGEELEKDPEAKKWMDEQFMSMMEEMGPLMQEMGSAAMNCKDDPGVAKAMEAMN